MPIISFCGSKGGSGKSTLCALVATELAAADMAVLVLDADPQGTVSQWAEQAMESQRWLPNLSIEKAGSEGVLGDRLTTSVEQDFVLIDVQGVLNQTLALAIVSSHVSIIPARASLADLREAVKVFAFARNLRRCNMRLILNAVNGIDRNTTAFREALAYIRSNKLPVLDTIIQQRPVYAQFAKAAPSLQSLETGPDKADQILKARSNIGNLIDNIVGCIEGSQVARHG